MHPEIKILYYHNLSFKEIDDVREQIIARQLNLYVNTTQLYLYLNQMNRKYKLILEWVQNLRWISLMGVIIFLFINWKVSLLLLFPFFITALSSSRLAMKYIKKQCAEDRVFLKFALSTELIKIAKKNQPLNDPIYKQFNLAG